MRQGMNAGRWFGMACSAAAVLAAGGAIAQERAEFAQADDPWTQQGLAAIEAAKAVQPIEGRAKNLILFIGDGMGVSTVTAGRIFEGQLRGELGEENVLSFETFPYLALSKTYNTNQQVSDSAGTATAYHTGVKAKAGVIGVSDAAFRADSRVRHVMPLSPASPNLPNLVGMSTGLVTSARVTHASPAPLYAHTPERNWEDDKDMPPEALAAGCKDIASQLIDFPYGDGLEVAMGGGRRSFLPADAADPEEEGQTGERQDGRDLTQEWVDKYDIAAFVWNQEQFDAIDPGSTDHLLGLFQRSHLQYEDDREQMDVGGEPSLAEMTAKAIEILSKNPEGFYLFVEGGRIDHGHHANNAHRALMDVVALNEAVQTAVDMTSEEDTLIVVSADHSHVFTIAGYPVRGNPILGKVVLNDDNGRPMEEPDVAADGLPYTTVSYANGPGAMFEIRDVKDEDDPNKVNQVAGRLDLTEVDTTDKDFIQQAAVPKSSETHAGEDVAIYARGPMAHLLDGTVEQTYIFHLLAEGGGLLDRLENTQ